MVELSALDFVNPYMSARRQFVCTQLALLLPNAVTTVSSNNPGTSARFKEWTGQSQSSLESAWTREGFTRGKTGSWTRAGAGAVTTSCEGLIGAVLNKIESAGYGKRRAQVSSFSLPGNDQWGKEPKTPTLGWHWYRDKGKGQHPQGGDFFQLGKLVRPGQWYHYHVGVITGWADGDSPSWETVEAGQGGPSTGFDFMKRKAWRPLTPLDPKVPEKVLMGWLDIDQLFGD